MYAYGCLAFVLLFDVPYLTRTVLIALAHRLKLTRKLDVRNGQESIVNSLCWTSDLDFLLHMNNSKYVRELDFGRMDFFTRTGLLKHLQKKNYSFVQNAAAIRFRRDLELFHPFSIVTKLAYFDSKYVYFEQQIVSKRTGFIHAIAYNKSVVLGCDDAAKFIMESLGISKLELPPEIKAFDEAHRVSSEALKAKL